MFSGIVSHSGTVVAVTDGAEAQRLVLYSPLFAEPDIRHGESVCVSGVCLTVVGFDAAVMQASFDLATETRRCTTLGNLQKGSSVNLERSLRLSDRIDGHLVQGHVDSVVEVRSVNEQENTRRVEFSLPQALARYIAPKGGVCIDGVSLTVGEVESESFSVYIIPHTWSETRCREYAPGVSVNIEIDCLARYVERMLTVAGRI